MSLKKLLLLSSVMLSSFIGFLCGIDTGHSIGSSKYVRNKSFLERTPQYFWNEKKPVFHWGVVGQKNPLVTTGGYHSKGSAGIIPYILHSGKIYILLSRETWGADKNTYCDLGGAVEVYGTTRDSLHVDTFLDTLLKEGEEESGGLYKFTKDEILHQAHVVSYTHRKTGFYEGFESVLAFCKVPTLYFADKFIEASYYHAQRLEQLQLSPWGYQEKDDYQWIELASFFSFVKNSAANEGVFKNIFNKDVTLRLRSHFIEVICSDDSLQVLAALLQEQLAFTLVEETYLCVTSMGSKNACSSCNKGCSLPRGMTAMAS